MSHSSTNQGKESGQAAVTLGAWKVLERETRGLRRRGCDEGQPGQQGVRLAMRGLRPAGSWQQGATLDLNGV